MSTGHKCTAMQMAVQDMQSKRTLEGFAAALPPPAAALCFQAKVLRLLRTDATALMPLSEPFAPSAAAQDQRI